MALEKQMNQAGQIILHTGKFLTLIKAGHWEYVDRVHGKGVALIIGVTTEKKLLLVEQYRIPVHARTIELPPGSSVTNRETRMNLPPPPPAANYRRKPGMLPNALKR
jgi:hypothetical protein